MNAHDEGTHDEDRNEASISGVRPRMAAVDDDDDDFETHRITAGGRHADAGSEDDAGDLLDYVESLDDEIVERLDTQRDRNPPRRDGSVHETPTWRPPPAPPRPVSPPSRTDETLRPPPPVRVPPLAPKSSAPRLPAPKSSAPRLPAPPVPVTEALENEDWYRRVSRPTSEPPSHGTVDFDALLRRALSAPPEPPPSRPRTVTIPPPPPIPSSLLPPPIRPAARELIPQGALALIAAGAAAIAINAWVIHVLEHDTPTAAVTSSVESRLVAPRGSTRVAYAPEEQDEMREAVVAPSPTPRTPGHSRAATLPRSAPPPRTEGEREERRIASREVASTTAAARTEDPVRETAASEAPASAPPGATAAINEPRVPTLSPRASAESAPPAPTDTDSLLRAAVTSRIGPPSADPSVTSQGLPETPTRAAVAAALRSVQPAVDACVATSGTVVIRLTVEGASGRVTSAIVTGEHAGTPAAACMAQAARSAQLPRFARESMSITYPFVLR